TVTGIGAEELAVFPIAVGDACDLLVRAEVFGPRAAYQEQLGVRRRADAVEVRLRDFVRVEGLEAFRLDVLERLRAEAALTDLLHDLVLVFRHEAAAVAAVAVLTHVEALSGSEYAAALEHAPVGDDLRAGRVLGDAHLAV